MFKGKQIKALQELTAKLTSQLEDQGKQIKQLEENITKTKETLNEMSSSRFDTLSDELKDFNTKLSSSLDSLEKLKSEIGELELVNKKIESIKDDLTNLDKKIIETKDLVQTNQISNNKKFESIEQNFKETVDTVTKIKEELEAERKKVLEGKETILKQEASLKEKELQLSKYDTELKEARTLIGKLKAENEKLEQELKDIKEERDNYHKKLSSLEKEFNDFKMQNKDQIVLNTGAKVLLEKTSEGKIFLALLKQSPQNIDDLAEKLRIPQVMVKHAINSLQESNIVKLDAETRMVSI